MKIKYKYILYAFMAAAVIILPQLTNNNYRILLLSQTLVNIIVVLGLNFITGLIGQMNLGMAGIFALGTYTSGLLTTRLGLSPWIGLLASIVMGLIIGIILGYPSLRFKGIYLALTTIAFGEIVRLLLTNLVDITGGTRGVSNIPTFKLFGYEFSTPRQCYYLILFFLVLLTITAVRIINSKWGRSFKAIRDNDSAVESCGINMSKVKITAFVMSAVYACVAGCLYAHLMRYITPSDFTFDMSVKYLMMLMLGGIGDVMGNIIGGSVITLLPEYLRFLDDYYWLVFSTIVFICVIVLPHGLVSLVKNPIWRKKKGKEMS